MGERNLLVIPVDGTSHTVPESPISQEFDLQEAFKKHPELIPGSDLGLGSLLVVARRGVHRSDGRREVGGNHSQEAQPGGAQTLSDPAAWPDGRRTRRRR